MVKLKSDAVPTRFKMAKIPSNGSLMEEHNTMTHSGSELLVNQEMDVIFVIFVKYMIIVTIVIVVIFVITRI